MKRVLSIAALTLLGVVGGGAILLRPATVPPEVIERAVIRDRVLLDKAWALPVAASYARRVDFQSNPSVCGPASVANVLRSLGEAADTESEVLATAGRCWFGLCFLGLSLDELAEVTRMATRRKVTVLRDLTPDGFRDELRQANDPARRYIVNFARTPIFGAGVGHHSPVGGFLEKEDLVLVLDVNERFRPWLVERSRLYDAMSTRDGDKTRGLIRIE